MSYYHSHTLVRALCISFKILCLIACEVRTRAFGDARAATNLQEAQKYFANSYLLGISPLPPSLPPSLLRSHAARPRPRSRSSKQIPTPLATQLLLAIKPPPAPLSLSLSRPQLYAPFFLRRRGEAGNIPTKTVQITTDK